MAKITKLTEAQEKRLVEFRAEWLQVGMCCEPADFAAGDEVIRGFYKRIGKPEPMILHFSSPAMCELAVNFIMGLLTDKPDQLWGQFRDQLRDQLGGQFRDQLWDQLRDQLGDQLRGQLWDQFRDQLRGQLWDQLRDQLWGQLWDQRLELKFLNNSFDNQYNVAWGAFYLFGHEIGVEYKTADMALLLEWARLFKSVGWWAPFDGICFVSDRPRKVSFDDDRRLHSETWKAVEYSDGWGVSAWHGTRVPDHWLADRDNLDPVEVLKTENTEQRAAGLHIVGMARMLDHVQHKIIDSHTDPQCGDLIEISIPGLPESELYLKFECPRNGLMMEAVNKRELKKYDLHHAHAWHANVPARLFSYPQQRS